MFFDDLSSILEISARTSCAIFVLPRDAQVAIKNAIILSPEEKSIITIDQVKNLIMQLNKRQITDQYIIIRPAELLGDEAANAFLKNLEEPNDKVHFVLITDKPFKLLPTILSRSVLYYLRQPDVIVSQITVDDKIKDLAKKLMVTRPSDLVKVADEICSTKENKREYALKVLETAIEMLFKSYFITNKQVFVKKLPMFLETYENIDKNGHVKLHLVADLC